MKPTSTFLEHVYGMRLAESAAGPSPGQLRKLCLLARCDDLIKGLDDPRLEAVGRALSVYADMNMLFSKSGLLLSAREKEALRSRLEQVMARASAPSTTTGLEAAKLLARAEQAAPSKPPAAGWDAASSGLSTARLLGNFEAPPEEEVWSDRERKNAEALARTRAAVGGSNVVSEQDVEDYLQDLRRRAARDPAFDEEVPSHRRYLIAPSILDAHRGANFYGPGRHRYPFYQAKGQIKRFAG